MRRPARRSDIAPLAMLVAVAVAGCSGDDGRGNGASSPTPAPHLRIVTTSGAPLAAVAGDALPLKVVQVSADGSLSDLPASATVTWTSPDALAAFPPDTQSSDLVSPLASLAGAPPTAVWITNPMRSDRSADLTNVLFVVDPGTLQDAALQVSATVSGSTLDGDVQAVVAISPTPMGDWRRGQALYGTAGANCAECHGASGHGSTGASPYTMDGHTYEYPAPGINAEPGNLASDPSWNAALLAFAARSDVDNTGVVLRVPMPDWLGSPNPASGHPLTTQDFADIYAFLKTETQ
jgi:mono/diheme cytochrome c family protein